MHRLVSGSLSFVVCQCCFQNFIISPRDIGICLKLGS